MKTPWWAGLWIFILEVLVIMILVPSHWMEGTIEREREMIAQHLGKDSSTWVTDTSDRWYTDQIVHTGVESGIYSYLVTPKSERKYSGGDRWFDWVEARIDTMFYVVEQTYQRAALVALWLPYLLILFVPSVVDGIMTWKIKRTNFDYASPVVHRYSLWLLFLLMYGLVVMLFIPFALNPVFIPGGIMLGSVLLGLMLGNLQKRV